MRRDAIAEPWWSDRPVIIVGTGPSLIGFDFSRLRGLGYILAVKEAVWDLPFADAVFALDVPWMRRNADRLSNFDKPVYLAIPAGEKDAPQISGATCLDRIRKTQTLSTDPHVIESGGNSGFGALNVAFLKRAKMIVLLGFDYRTGGKGHYCQERYIWQKSVHHNTALLPRWAMNFRDTLPQIKASGIEVVNASPDSTVDAFRKCSIDEALQHLDRIRCA